jgi:hypothetical protein
MDIPIVNERESETEREVGIGAGHEVGCDAGIPFGGSIVSQGKSGVLQEEIARTMQNTGNLLIFIKTV